MDEKFILIYRYIHNIVYIYNIYTLPPLQITTMPRRKASNGVAAAVEATTGKRQRHQAVEAPSKNDITQLLQQIRADRAAWAEECRTVRVEMAEERQQARQELDEALATIHASGGKSMVQIEAHPSSSASELATGQGTPTMSLFEESTGTGSVDQAMVPVDLHVTEELRHQIWANKAIDLDLLLEDSFPSRKRKGFNGNKGEQEILSEKQWLAVWNTFTAVYAAKEPSAIAGLCAHMKQVSDLMEAKADWRFYDLQSRRMVEVGRLKWGGTNTALLAAASMRGIKTWREVDDRDRKGTSGIPRGYCYAFHTKGQCNKGDNCPFQHICYKCASKTPHSVRNCWGGGRNRENTGSGNRFEGTDKK